MNGAEITRWRKSQGMDLRELAAILDTSHSALNRWENGQDIPGPAKKLLALLIHGTPPFGGDDPKAAEAMHKHLLPAKLEFRDFETLAADASAQGFRTLKEYVQHWMKTKAEEVRARSGSA